MMDFVRLAPSLSSVSAANHLDAVLVAAVVVAIGLGIAVGREQQDVTIFLDESVSIGVHPCVLVPKPVSHRTRFEQYSLRRPFLHVRTRRPIDIPSVSVAVRTVLTHKDIAAVLKPYHTPVGRFRSGRDARAEADECPVVHLQRRQFPVRCMRV